RAVQSLHFEEIGVVRSAFEVLNNARLGRGRSLSVALGQESTIITQEREPQVGQGIREEVGCQSTGRGQSEVEELRRADRPLLARGGVNLDEVVERVSGEEDAVFQRLHTESSGRLQTGPPGGPASPGGEPFSELPKP